MDIGTLTIQLAADMATLRRDMDDAKSSVGSAMADIERTVGIAKTALVALTGIASVGAFAGMIQGAIDAAEALKDLSIQTGVSVETLSAMTEVGRTTGTSADTISAAMNKLSKNMATASEDGKGAGAAIKALGLGFDSFRAMRPDDQMLALAQAMNKFEDGGGKSAAAMTLMGREGAKLLPYLTDLANAGELVATVTKEQAEMADQYNDAMAVAVGRGDALKRSLALGLLPTLIEVHDVTLELGNAFNTYIAGGADNASAKMGAMHSVSSVVGTIFETLLVIGSDLAFVFNGIGREMGGIAAQGAALLRGDFAQVGEIQRQLVADGEKARAELDKYQSSIVGMTGKVQQASDAVAGSTVTAADNAREMRNLKERTGEATLGQVQFTESSKEAEKAAKAHAKELAQQEAAYVKLTSSIDSKLVAMEQQLASGEKLTEAQKIENQLYQDLANSVVVLTDKELAETLAKLGQLDATERHNNIRKEEKKLAEEIEKDKQAQIVTLRSQTASLDKGNESLADQNLKLTMTSEAYIYLTAQRLIDDAVQLEQIATTSDQSGELLKQAGLLRERAELLQDGVVLKEAKAAADEWAKTTKQIGDGLTNALTRAVLDGKDIWLTFRDYMVSVILDGVLKNAIGSVISSALSGLSGSISSIFSSAIGSAATGTTSGVGSTLGSIGSNIAGSSVGQTVGSALGIGSTGFTGTGLTGAVGIGASAGTGVTTAAVTGQGLGVVGTDLGLLGAGTTTGTTAGTAAGASGLGAVGVVPGAIAVIGAAYILNEMLTGSGISRELVGTGTLDYAGSFGAITIPGGRDQGDTVYQPKAGATVTYEHQRTNTGLDEYIVMVDGMIVGASYTLDDAKQYIANPMPPPPGYATGGDHPGGLRLVGERGPELEATGPSRIFDAQTTASMLRSGGANDSEVVAELRAMRQQIADLQSTNKKTADVLVRSSQGGDSINITTDATSGATVLVL